MKQWCALYVFIFLSRITGSGIYACFPWYLFLLNAIPVDLLHVAPAYPRTIQLPTTQQL